MIIRFSEVGESLGTRFSGEMVRKKFEKALAKGESVTFDFEGVKSISHSFADECFAKLLNTWTVTDLKELTTFQNADPLIKKTIAFTMRGRQKEAFA